MTTPATKPRDGTVTDYRALRIAARVEPKPAEPKPEPAADVPAVALDESLEQRDRNRLRDALDHGEYGDAVLFTELYKDRLVYDHGEQCWNVWNGNAFARDKSEFVTRLIPEKLGGQYYGLAQELVAELAQVGAEAQPVDADGATDADAEKKAEATKAKKRLLGQTIGRCQKLHEVRRVGNVLRFARSGGLLGMSGDEFDANPWLLAVDNGVIDLQTGVFRPGRPGDFLRTVAPAAWISLDQQCPMWERTLGEIFGNQPDKAAIITCLQRLLGYGITGSTREQNFTIFYGPGGRNGKDTVLGTIRNVLGAELAGPISADVILAGKPHSKGAANPELYDLRGKRLAWVNESNEGAKFDMSRVKELSGGDNPIPCRPLYGGEVRFTPTHKLLLMTNYKPHAKADDDAFWDRMIMFPFTLRFLKPADFSRPGGLPAENERARNPLLKEQLKAEAGGILAWLVRGCLDWQREGLAIPASLRAARREYREEEDSIQQFIDNCCITGEGKQAKSGELWKAYTAWCEAGDMKAESLVRFGSYLKGRYEKTTPGNVATYHGIGLLQG